MEKSKKEISSKTGSVSMGNAGWIDLIFESNGTYGAKKLTNEQTKAFNAIKNSARELAKTVAKNIPDGTDQTNALRLIRDAFFVATTAVGASTNA